MALLGIALRAHPAGTLVGWHELCYFVFQRLARQGRPTAESGPRLVADAVLLEGGSQLFAVELRMPAAAGNASDIDYLLDAVVLEVAEKSLDGEVGGAKRLGVRAGNWLTRPQAVELLGAPDSATLKGKRDLVLLALLLGCGLRRGELAQLLLSDIAQREGRWVIIDLVGKHGRIRTVPMPSWAKAALDRWTQAAGISEGRVLRAINKGGRIRGDSMTPQSVFETVVEYGGRIGLKITPHDLRRTFAKLAHQGQAALEQIQLSLGHASIQTTERYLGVRQDLHDAPCDRLGLDVGGAA